MPLAPYKKKLRRYAKTKKFSEDNAADLMLYDSSKKHFCRYSVYMDSDIGIDYRSQHLINKTNLDDDCESSDEIITEGVRRALLELKEAITKKKA